jgi:hypothetical protein
LTVGCINEYRMKASQAWETTQESRYRSCQQCRGTATTADSIGRSWTKALTSRIEAPKSIEWCRGTESVGCIIEYQTFASASGVQTEETRRFRVHVQHETKNKLTRTILLNKWNEIFSSMNKLSSSLLLKHFHYFYNKFFWFVKLMVQDVR